MLSWPALNAEVGDVTISYRRTGGDKAPAVLLHGLMGSGTTWTPVAQALAEELDVILPDARGHGRSSTPDSGYRYPDLAADVVGLIQQLNLARPLLVGHSMGGMTAALTAVRMGHQLRGLVLVDPTFLSREQQLEVFESDVAGRHRVAVSLGQATLTRDGLERNTRRSPELVTLQVEARMNTNLAAFDILRPPNPPYRELVSALDVPTLLVIGDNPVVSLELACELGELNPLLRVEQINDAGHGLPFDQPERLARSVAAFARELAGGSTTSPEIGAVPRRKLSP